MHKRVFAVVCDSGYFAGLKGLLNSLYAYHGSAIPVFIYESGFGSGELRWIEAHPLRTTVFRVSELPHHARGMWEAKQQVFAHCLGRARTVFLLDADLVLTSAMVDVWEAAESGRIVAGYHGDELRYDARYDVYGQALPGQRHAHLSTAAICLDVERHWDLAGLWAFTTNFSEYTPGRGFPLALPGHGDQGLFNALVARLGKLDQVHLLPHGLWHDSGAEAAMRIVDKEADGKLEVWNEKLGALQRLLHASGKKWWTDDGARHQSTFGDRLRCFLHFERMQAGAAPLAPGMRIVPVGWEKFQSAGNGPRILVAICSSRRGAERRAAVRETWLKRLPAGVAAFFFVGDGRGEVEPDVAVLEAADDYHSLPEKVHAMFRYAFEHYEFDYLFKCDDDTYLCAERLASLAKPEAQFIGDESVTRYGFAQGGAGYLIARPLAETLTEAGWAFRGPEDVFVSRAAMRQGITIEVSPRLKSGPETPPAAWNDVITAHHVNPKLMRSIDAELLNPPMVMCEFTARHSQWTGRVELLNDGTFRGGAAKPDGRWEMSSNDEELILKWYHWPEDRMKRTESGFAGGDLSMERSESDPQALA